MANQTRSSGLGVVIGIVIVVVVAAVVVDLFGNRKEPEPPPVLPTITQSLDPEERIVRFQAIWGGDYEDVVNIKILIDGGIEFEDNVAYDARFEFGLGNVWRHDTVVLQGSTVEMSAHSSALDEVTCHIVNVHIPTNTVENRGGSTLREPAFCRTIPMTVQ